MHAEKSNSRGYVLVHRDWYEEKDEPNMLRRNAIITTLNPEAFTPGGASQIVKRGYAILEPPNEVPFAFTICDCRPIAGKNYFDTLEDAQDHLRELGVQRPDMGFNPVE